MSSFLNTFIWLPNEYQSSFIQVMYVGLCVLCVLVAQSYPTLCKAMDCSPPGSSVHGILQAGIPKWVAIPFSNSNKDTIILSVQVGRL